MSEQSTAPGRAPSRRLDRAAVLTALIPELLLRGTPWLQVWRAHEARMVVIAARVGLGVAAIGHVLHHFLVDAPLGISERPDVDSVPVRKRRVLRRAVRAHVPARPPAPAPRARGAPRPRARHRHHAGEVRRVAAVGAVRLRVPAHARGRPPHPPVGPVGARDALRLLRRAVGVRVALHGRPSREAPQRRYALRRRWSCSSGAGCSRTSARSSRRSGSSRRRSGSSRRRSSSIA